MPQETLAADIGAVAGSVSLALDAIDIKIGGIDDDRAGRLPGFVAHFPAVIFLVDEGDIGGGNREFVVGHGPVEFLRLGQAHPIASRAAGQPEHAETGGGAGEKRPAAETAGPQSERAAVAHTSSLGGSVASIDVFRAAHVVSLGEKKNWVEPVERYSSAKMPSSRSIGKLKPS